MALMAGDIGCRPWTNAEGQVGNAFWITLPATALPFRAVADDALRTQILQAIRATEGAGDAGLPPAPAIEAGCDPAEVPVDPRQRPMPRTRILLADDIPANQLVTATLLRREGHFVDVVANGEAAVEAVRTVPYDLILMDVFMPRMDGPEVARIIRSLPAPACAIPILALTAGVPEEDPAAFKAAGMNGVLGKPVSVVELVDALRTYVWSPDPAGKISSVPVEAPAGPDNAGPWAVLSHARIAELRTNLPPETFATLIEECLADLDHRLPALRRAVTAGNPAAITAHVPTMVSVAAGYGMTALETRLRMIIAAARDGDMRTLTAPLVAGLEADLTKAARLLRDIAQIEPV